MTQYVRYPLSNLNSLLSGYVPYNGANQDLNLNAQRLIVDTIVGFTDEGILIQHHSIRDIAKFNYGTVAQQLWSPTNYLMEFNATSYDLQTNYVMSSEELSSVGVAAPIGSWGRSGDYFEIKYNTGDSDWGKVLYVGSDQFIRNPEYPFTGNANLSFDVPSGLYQCGDINGVGNNVQLYVDSAGGQIVFGSFISGDTFYYDYSGVMIFSFAYANLYTFSGTSLAIGTKLTMSQVASSATDGDLFHDSTQKQITAYTAGVTQCLVGTLFTKNGDQTKANSITQSSIVGSGTGTLGLPANFWVTGKSIRFTLRGYKSATATPNITFRIKLDSTVIATTGAIASTNGTNYGWEIAGIITCRSTGGVGTVSCSGKYIELITGGAIAGIIQTGTTTINTTTSASLDVSIEWGTAHASNTITSQVGEFVIEN